MLRNTLAVLAVLALAASSQAGVIISSASSATVGHPELTTWTLTAASDNGAQIQGFDFASQAAFGFSGPMNQVNPAGNPTIFQDANGFFGFVGADVSQDSQFKFLTSAVTVPAGFASEGANSLRAVFASATGLGTSVAFAQLAIPNAGSGTVQFLGQVQTVLQGGAPVDNNVQGTVGGPVIPEPASLALVGLALLGLVGYRRR